MHCKFEIKLPNKKQDVIKKLLEKFLKYHKFDDK